MPAGVGVRTRQAVILVAARILALVALIVAADLIPAHLGVIDYV